MRKHTANLRSEVLLTNGTECAKAFQGNRRTKRTLPQRERISEGKQICRKYEVETLTEIQNQVGLHARPATFFIQKANEYKSSIWVEKEERRVNAKSLLGVLSLGIVGGTIIRVIADGADEQQAVEGLVALVESGFSE